MVDDPPILDSFPAHPLPEAAIKDLGDSDAIIGALPFPEEAGIRGFILE